MEVQVIFNISINARQLNCFQIATAMNTGITNILIHVFVPILETFLEDTILGREKLKQMHKHLKFNRYWQIALQKFRLI